MGKDYYLKSMVFGDYYTKGGVMSYKTDNIKYFETEEDAYNEALQKRLSYVTVCKKDKKNQKDGEQNG